MWSPSFLKDQKKEFFVILIGSIIISGLVGGLVGYFTSSFLKNQDSVERVIEKIIREPQKDNQKTSGSDLRISEESLVVEVVKRTSPAVVSIIATKDLPIIEQRFIDPFEEFLEDPFFRQFFGERFKFQIPQFEQKGTEKQEVSAGSGFLISSDGLILTNRHVIDVSGAEFTAIFNDGRKFPVKVLAKDPLLDLAILKIKSNSSNFQFLTLGDSDKLQIGQTVIAIGNALGEFRNTVSKGVISGLSRSIVASSGTTSERLEQVIQTDAAINKGNSGGPLLNLKGEVIGINTAIVLGAQNIGFAIPINQAKKDIEQVKVFGKIVIPFLGVRYIILNDKIARLNSLPVDYGALVIGGEGSDEEAVIPNSPAQRAGIREGDIILEMDGEKITEENTLAKIITTKKIGQEVELKILRDKSEKIIKVILEEKK